MGLGGFHGTLRHFVVPLVFGTAVDLWNVKGCFRHSVAGMLIFQLVFPTSVCLCCSDIRSFRFHDTVASQSSESMSFGSALRCFGGRLGQRSCVLSAGA